MQYTATSFLTMDANNLAELYANLSLNASPPEVLEVDKGTLVAECLRVGNWLVGKVLTTRSINREAFRSSIGKL